MPMGLSASLIVSGRVHPERADVHIYPIRLVLKNETIGIQGTLDLWIVCSQIQGQFVGSYDNLVQLKQGIEDACRQLVDALGYAQGCGYDVEITQISNPSNTETIVFSVQEEGLAQIAKWLNVEFNQIAPLLNSPYGTYVRRCLADLREAIRNPADCGFHCYRALESLKWAFAEDSDDESAAWEKLRTAANVSREEIVDEIKLFADGPRHGRAELIPLDQRRQLLTLTWEIVGKVFLALIGKMPDYQPFQFTKPPNK